MLEILQHMASKPQDCHLMMTTNTVEGLALMYRGKRIDLGHRHYVCKTNMAICHKVCVQVYMYII